MVRELIRQGFSVRGMARHPESARKLLPPEVELISGDLRSVSDIRRAAQGCETVYLNLSTANTRAPFRPELDGTGNVIKALEERPEVTIAKISALEAGDTGGKWPDSDQKMEAENALKNSGNPYLIFRPTWFFESLPLFIQNRRLLIFGWGLKPVYWIAGADYARMVCAAFKQRVQNRVYNVQGPEALTLEEAARRFLDLFMPQVKILTLPIFFLKAAGLFQPQAGQLYHLMKNLKSRSEEMISETTWEELYRPTMKVEDYVAYLRETGDVPSKR